MRESHYLGVSSQGAPVHGTAPDCHVLTRVCEFDEKTYFARKEALRLFTVRSGDFQTRRRRINTAPVNSVISIVAIFSLF